MVALSATGEIADFQDVDQFLPNHSYFECGFFSVAMVKAMNKVGETPTLTVDQMGNDAESWYAADYKGDNSPANRNGMTTDQLYALLESQGLRYIPLNDFDLELIRSWILQGTPVIVSVAETSVCDIGLGNCNPYQLWTPQNNHIITLTGIHADGNFLVRDTANVWPDYFTLRPGPRIYDANNLLLVSATVIIPPWLPTPPENFDPRKDTLMPNTHIIPSGWNDDGTTLTAPNGHKVIRGFRAYVLASNWHPFNYPLEEEVVLNSVEESNPSLGYGSQQIFRWTTLEWTPSRNVFVAWTGQELLKVRADRDALKAQVSDLEAKLKANQSHSPLAH